MSLEDSRREYQYGRLRRESLKDSPFEQFNLWMEQAIHSDLSDPTAMCLATVNAEGKPWQRTVLLKGMDERGLMFYTNLGSRKAREMSGNPNVSLIFPWMRMDRQVIVGGQVERLTKTEVLSYFLKRPRGSQLAAWASQQSSRLSSRQALETQFIQMKEKFAAGEIPVPDFWGGYRESLFYDRYCGFSSGHGNSRQYYHESNQS